MILAFWFVESDEVPCCGSLCCPCAGPDRIGFNARGLDLACPVLRLKIIRDDRLFGRASCTRPLPANCWLASPIGWITAQAPGKCTNGRDAWSKHRLLSGCSRDHYPGFCGILSAECRYCLLLVYLLAVSTTPMVLFCAENRAAARLGPPIPFAHPDIGRHLMGSSRV
jgi:hypothetical protein